MNVAADTVVIFDYVLTDDDGAVIDRGDGDEAMAYIHGHDQIVPGLERALEGKTNGDKLSVVVAPADGYGERSDQEEMRAPRSEFPEEMDLEPGAELEAEDEDGGVDVFWVIEADKEWVTLTRDHPLSGVTLHFDVSLREVRAATPEELEHGHAHWPGHHHHDD